MWHDEDFLALIELLMMNSLLREDSEWAEFREMNLIAINPTWTSSWDAKIEYRRCFAGFAASCMVLRFPEIVKGRRKVRVIDVQSFTPWLSHEQKKFHECGRVTVMSFKRVSLKLLCRCREASWATGYFVTKWINLTYFGNLNFIFCSI